MPNPHPHPNLEELAAAQECTVCLYILSAEENPAQRLEYLKRAEAGLFPPRHTPRLESPHLPPLLARRSRSKGG